eukprot:CAMPEP_0198421536 /NCGR_PEP_ID=MMETSP1452-20131203/1718_1 /TAXON_ID=1181717 /ORGANISM="Synchroma pusillum, Strain CCMP3072" /LENGTH=94 /DNA_ID=CAMNT_0044141751 /DNA_START=6 /DNA_END=286 /DNA_ORIENTATION=-
MEDRELRGALRALVGRCCSKEWARRGSAFQAAGDLDDLLKHLPQPPPGGAAALLREPPMGGAAAAHRSPEAEAMVQSLADLIHELCGNLAPEEA